MSTESVGTITLREGHASFETRDEMLASWLTELFEKGTTLQLEVGFQSDEGSFCTRDVPVTVEDPRYPGVLAGLLPEGYVVLEALASEPPSSQVA